MRNWALLVIAALRLDAAILRGNVVEHATGKALARSLVAILPLPGSSGPTLSVRTNNYGSFEFLNLPAGGYLVNASRRGFAPVHYGQKRWNAPGTPVILEQEQSVSISLRLPRYGAITGFVVDENDAGMFDHEVVAYRNSRPPTVVAKFPTDDRGWFRVWGLEPGNYLVRTAGRRYEDGDYLPTFFRESLRVEEAVPVQVALDQDTPDVRVRPFPGRLLNISGEVKKCYPTQTVTLTLVGEMGRETITTGESFAFFGKPPGNYEIFAEAPADRRYAIGPCGAYVPLALENHDYEGVQVALTRLPSVGFTFEGVDGLAPNAIRILARRKDMAGISEPQTWKLNNGSIQVNPGRWELELAPSPGYVAIDFRGPKGERPESGRADGWNEVLINGNSSVRYVLSNKPGGIHGVVTGPGHEAVPGAPVSLEAYEPQSRKRIHELRTVRADVQGRYQFFGLEPGAYRVFSTLDLEAPEAAEVDALDPKTIQVEQGRDHQLDLDLSVIR